MPMDIEAALKKAVDSAAQTYAENYTVRAFVQAVPHIGGALDGVFGGYGASLVFKRQMRLIEDLKQQMARVDESKVDTLFVESEEFAHLVMKALDHAGRIGKIERVQLLAQALKSAVSYDWGASRAADSEALLDLTATIDVRDAYYVLELARKYRNARATPHRLQVFAEVRAGEIIKEIGSRTINRLVARGLLREIVGTYTGYEGGAYEPTSLAFELAEFLESGEADSFRIQSE